jgi:hypothetical protein
MKRAEDRRVEVRLVLVFRPRGTRPITTATAITFAESFAALALSTWKPALVVSCRLRRGHCRCILFGSATLGVWMMDLRVRLSWHLRFLICRDVHTFAHGHGSFQDDREIRTLSNSKDRIDSDQADVVAVDSRFVIYAVLANSKNDRLKQRHWPEGMPSSVSLAKHVMSGTEVVDLTTCGHDYAGTFAAIGPARTGERPASVGLGTEVGFEHFQVLTW